MDYAYPCKCKPKDRDRYRRLNANDKPGAVTLYCLGCRGSWVSKRKYASTLPVHVPRTRGKLTDDDVFEMLQAGEISVTPMTAEVSRAGKRIKVIERTHPSGDSRGTYRFVDICKSERRKKIALHRLVWIAYTGETIPDGYDVDHVFGSECGDEIWNLRLLPSYENRALGAAKARANALQEEVLF